VAKYKYDFEYQLDILKLCVQDQGFLTKNPEVVQPHYFSIDSLMVLAQVILGYYKKFRSSPDYVHLREELSTYFATYNVNDSIQLNVSSLADRIYRELPRNPKAIADTISKFAQKQSINLGIREVVSILEQDGDLEKVPDIMRRAYMIGSRQREGWSFTEQVSTLSDRIRSDKNYNPANKLATGFKEIDNATFGGIGSGQIWVVAAKPKGGKTTLMTTIATEAIRQKEGHVVYHYSFGDMNKVDVLMKYVQCFTGLTVHQILSGPGFVDMANVPFRHHPKSHLEIIYESPGVMGVEDLYNDVGYRMALTGKKPDLIVVDYANKMKQSLRDNTYRSMSFIYEGLKEIGDVYDCGILTGVQIRRGGDRESGQPEDIADSWLQVADCDAMIIINQTDVENQNNEARLSMPIVRRGRSISSIRVQFHKETARIRDK
jgi:replicative DNA helicase